MSEVFDWADHQFKKPVLCKVKIRKDIGKPVKSQCQKIDGIEIYLTPSWQMDDSDSDPYPGEWALTEKVTTGLGRLMLEGEIVWIASGDVEVIQQTTNHGSPIFSS